MSVVVRGSAKFTPAGVASTRPFKVPAVALVGDTVIFQSIIPTGSGVLTPSGITGLVEHKFQTYSGHRHALWIKQGLTAEDIAAAINWVTTSSTGASASYKVGLTATVLGGVDPTTAIDVSLGVNGPTGGSLTVTSPTITTLTPGAIELQFIASSNAAGVTSYTCANTTLTKAQQVFDPTVEGGAGGATSAVVAYNLTPQAAGSTPGNDEWTINRTNLLSAFTVAIKPAPVAQTAGPRATPGLVRTRGNRIVNMAAVFDSATASQWEWNQQAGPAVATVGSGNSRSFVAPPLFVPATLQFRVRGMVDGAWSPYTNVTVEVQDHLIWTVKNGVPVPRGLGTKPVLVAPVEPTPEPETPPPPPPVVVTPPVTPPIETASPGLPFKLAADARSHTKKYFGHYFGPYPRSTDNANPATDYYKRNYLNPGGEKSLPNFPLGRKYATGGLLRDRPLPVQPGPANWKVLNAKTEIQWAIDSGMDGFFVDLLGLTGQNMDNYLALRDAANLYFNNVAGAIPFYVIPMIDANGAHSTATPTQVAASIAKFHNLKSSYKLPDGRFLVASFKCEEKTEAWWISVLDACRVIGINPAFAGVFLNYGGQQANYPNILDIGSTWGMGSDPNVIAKFSNQAATARANGQLWMQPVQPQNVRPNQFWFDEAANTGSLRAGWARAVKDNADFVQIVTWSDFSEGGQAMPSVQSGFVNCDLNAYYSMWWKTGVKPKILRDAIYLSHRNQLLNATPQFVSTSPMTQRAQTNRTPQRDTVEVLTFFLAPTTVTVAVGSNTYTYTAPAGEFVQTFPLANGAISASGSRGSTVVASITSPIGCTASPPVQDRGYYRFSSLRSTDTYYVPTNLDGL